MNAPPVQYVRTSDGYDIAYRMTGSGVPLVFVGDPLIDMHSAWEIFPEWLGGLAQRFQVVKFDSRGQGLSTRSLSEDTTFSHYDRDLEAVVDRLGLARCLLWGWAARGHLAIRYASANPQRVAGLILNTCQVDNSSYPPALFRDLPREDWVTFLGVIARSGREEPPLSEVRRRIEAFERSTSAEDWEVGTRAMWQSDVEEELRGLSVPTLVMHRRGAQRFPESESIKVAGLIPDARFVLIDDGFVYGDAAQGLAAIDEFLKDLHENREPGAADSSNLSTRELEVLRMLAAGKSNQEIADELVISRNTVRRHVSHIFDKTGVANRAQAGAYARDHGLT